MTRITTLVSTHRIFIGDLQTPINIQLWKDQETELISATTDRGIVTPCQLSVEFPQPGGFHRTTPESALLDVISGYECYYLQAIEEGHTPAESWLIAE